jgi:hypothetical protein
VRSNSSRPSWASGLVERDQELLGRGRRDVDAPVQAGIQAPQRLVGIRLAVAVQVESDAAEVQRQLDVRRLNLCQCGFGFRQVRDEGLQDLSALGVAEPGRLRIRRQGHPQDGHRDVLGMIDEAVLIQRLRQAFHGASEPQHAQAEPRFVVARLGLEVFCQGRVSLPQLAGRQILLDQRRRPLIGRRLPRGQANHNARQDYRADS